MRASTRRAHAIKAARRLCSDQRGLGAIEWIVVLVLIVALSVAFWNLFGNDVACRFSDAIVSFDGAKRPAPSQCVDSAASIRSASARGGGSSGGARARSPANGRGGARGGAQQSGSGQTARPQVSAAPAGVPPANRAPQALAPSAPAATTAPAPSPSSGPPSLGDRVESALATVGQHAVDFGEGVVAGANPLTPVMPVELKPTFGNQITYGTGQIVGSVVGLLDDAGNMIAGGTGMVASTGVLVLSDGTLAPVALPGFGASATLTSVGAAGAAGHGRNFMKGLDNVAHGENAPSRASESGHGGGESPAKPEPSPEVEPKSASNAAEHQRYLEQLREEAGHVDLVDAKARNHILNGDTSASGHRGGGHQYPGGAGKSAFPRQWSSDRIIHEISDVATDPSAVRSIGQNGNTIVKGTRDGIDITVIVTPKGRIVTGFPTNVPRNP